ncbi:retrovirus-related pol polyprotein from transposon TNT 1-94 [Tanacetum coccineum]
MRMISLFIYVALGISYCSFLLFLEEQCSTDCDDMLIACMSKEEINRSTKSLHKKEFSMKELGEAKKILGMEIIRDQSYKIRMVSQSSWKAMLQRVVALLTTKAEYMALTEAVKKANWLRGLLEELGVELNTVAVNCDNQGAIHLSQNHVFHKSTKHINVRYHFMREVLEAKMVKVLKVGTKHNVDALTKVVPGLNLQHCLELLSVGIC